MREPDCIQSNQEEKRVVSPLPTNAQDSGDLRQVARNHVGSYQKGRGVMTARVSNEEQLQKMKTHPGFIAALDQSGGSTPHALALYGIKDHSWSDDDEMFDLVHQMRTRVITSPSFTGERIIGAILFEDTMDREIKGEATADYLWNVKRVVPFLKVDKGLEAQKDGVQMMKPMPELGPLLEKAKSKRIFGTKMRSLILSLIHI